MEKCRVAYFACVNKLVHLSSLSPESLDLTFVAEYNIDKLCLQILLHTHNAQKGF